MRPRVVVLGMLSKMPVAGVVWQTAHYLVGLERLGYEPYYVEAHARTPSMFVHGDGDKGSAGAAAFIDRVMRRFGLAGRWAFHALHDDGACFGMTKRALGELYGSAALLLNLHGATNPLPEHAATGRLVFVETDPVELQIHLHNGNQAAVDYLAPHSAFFTFGENAGSPDCRLPVSDRFPFRATRQPVVLEFWAGQGSPGSLYTTVGNWRQRWRYVEFEGEVYSWSKDHEFLKFLDLPARAGRRFELALGSLGEADRRLLEANGWHVRAAREISEDVDVYRGYVTGSRGEFTVAKDQNVRLRTGWFSDRSATYLAAGRPVIVQDTGFGSTLPTGEGLFAFTTLEEAAEAVERVERDYDRHAPAAAAIAREHFDSSLVLRRLLAETGLDVGRPKRPARAPVAEAGARAGLSTNGRPSDDAARGVNVVGYVRNTSGLGAAARGYVRALRQLGVPIAFDDLSDWTGVRSDDSALRIATTERRYDVNLVCVNPPDHFGVVSNLGREFFRDRFNVGIWAWELPRFPEKWYDRFPYYDEIWVGTSFIADTLAAISPVPVVRIPPVLTPEKRGSRSSGRKKLGAAPDEFVFLFIFDFYSSPARKNPIGLVDAFKSAFGPTDPVRLVLKCANGKSRPELEEMTARSRGARISIYDGYWSGSAMRDLMAASDAYVSLHRSEGTGLTITDAMALGKPVVATGWSGNMDFMTVANSFPVRFELVELADRVGHYAAGERWAEPSVEHAAELMRFVFEHRDEAAARGRAARADIEAKYSESAVAALVARRLELARARGRLGALASHVRGGAIDVDALLADFDDVRGFVPADYLGYLKSKHEFRKTVCEAVPPGARVAVVSKGDGELLELDGREACHFPRTADGIYAGYHPKDSEAAIAHLEELRAKGAAFLVFPEPSLWWLDHYKGLRRHLESRYRIAAASSRAVVYDLGNGR